MSIASVISVAFSFGFAFSFCFDVGEEGNYTLHPMAISAHTNGWSNEKVGS